MDDLSEGDGRITALLDRCGRNEGLGEHMAGSRSHVRSSARVVRRWSAGLVAVLAVAALAAACTPPSGGGGGGPTTVPTDRNLVDRPDESSLRQVKALYVLPSDGADRAFDTNGRIATSIESVQRWFEAQSGGTRLRFDTYDGQLDIAFIRLSKTTAEVEAQGSPLATLVQALASAGFDDPKKSYVMFYDGRQDGVCGSAYRPGTEAGIYLQTPNCDELGLSLSSPRWIDYTVIHEIFHNLGAVADCAPNANSGHVGDVPNDLMYSGPLPRPLPRVLDDGRNDYWGHGRTDCVDVARSPFLAPLPAVTDSPPTAPVVRTPRGPEVAALSR